VAGITPRVPQESGAAEHRAGPADQQLEHGSLEFGEFHTGVGARNDGALHHDIVAGEGDVTVMASNRIGQRTDEQAEATTTGRNDPVNPVAACALRRDRPDTGCDDRVVEGLDNFARRALVTDQCEKVLDRRRARERHRVDGAGANEVNEATRPIDVGGRGPLVDREGDHVEARGNQQLAGLRATPSVELQGHTGTGRGPRCEVRNEDIETLYRMVPIGTPVYIY